MGVACQYIKDNDKQCRNYARIGMKCCYVHRQYESVKPRVVKPDPPKPEPNQCCCLNMKQNKCPIDAQILIEGKWYCWRHEREFYKK
jgi:hypothetical protein